MIYDLCMSAVSVGTCFRYSCVCFFLPLRHPNAVIGSQDFAKESSNTYLHTVSVVIVFAFSTVLRHPNAVTVRKILQ